MIRSWILPTATAALLLVSACTVKEPRGDCPCYVTLDLDDFARLQDYDKGKVGMHSGSELSEEDISPAQYMGRGYETSVRRVPSVFFTVVGHEGLSFSSDTLRVAFGREWTRVMADSVAGECSGDSEYLKLSPRKEYCTVFLVVVGKDSSIEDEYDFRVRANSCGIRLRDRASVRGAFSAVAQNPWTGSVYSVTMPRQSDYDAVLDILVHEDTRMYTVDDHVADVKLGAIMQANGYDWTKDSLDDIYVTVDFASANVSVGIEEWKDEDIQDQI